MQHIIFDIVKNIIPKIKGDCICFTPNFKIFVRGYASNPPKSTFSHRLPTMQCCTAMARLHELTFLFP